MFYLLSAKVLFANRVLLLVIEIRSGQIANSVGRKLYVVIFRAFFFAFCLAFLELAPFAPMQLMSMWIFNIYFKIMIKSESYI